MSFTKVQYSSSWHGAVARLEIMKDVYIRLLFCSSAHIMLNNCLCIKCRLLTLITVQANFHVSFDCCSAPKSSGI
jgi:hypothetical protein